MIEAFLTKIAAAIFKKALIGSVLKTLASAYSIYSAVDTIVDVADCLDSANDCSDLGVCGLHVVSPVLTEVAMDRLLEVGSHSFTVEKTSSGIYVASQVTPSFKVSPGYLPSGVFSGGRSSFSSGGRKGFSAGGRGVFRTGGRG